MAKIGKTNIEKYVHIQGKYTGTGISIYYTPPIFTCVRKQPIIALYFESEYFGSGTTFN